MSETTATHDLDPWFYPVTLGTRKVVPGKGSPRTAKYLEARTHYRRPLLVDALVKLYEFTGKSMLDLACNCGYWGSQYTKYGLQRYQGVEGRQLFVTQARHYWATNNFLPFNSYRFTRASVSKPKTYLNLDGPYDFTLVAGILYHVPDYAYVLTEASNLTKEAMLVDTRVTDRDEKVQAEQSDLLFNGIDEERERKIVPNKQRLIYTLQSLGWSTVVLEHPHPRHEIVADFDEYGRVPGRCAIYCWR